MKHKSVLLKEVVELLNVKKGGRFVDATAGSGGHLREIWKEIKGKGEILAIDWDERCIDFLKKEFSSERGIFFINGNYKDIDLFLKKLNWNCIDGILFDLGIGSHQLDDEKRGFSFRFDSPLDMRYSRENNLTAEFVLNNSSEEKLSKIFKEFGEEFFAKRIAKEIVKNRPLKTTKELAEIVSKVKGRRGKIHPATKVFQALRIFVNQEIENLKVGLKKSLHFLSKTGRIAVISYHSIEDRIVKKFFVGLEKKGVARRINKRVITPAKEEILKNRRSRSAKLRVIEKI